MEFSTKFAFYRLSEVIGFDFNAKNTNCYLLTASGVVYRLNLESGNFTQENLGRKINYFKIIPGKDGVDFLVIQSTDEIDIWKILF